MQQPPESVATSEAIELQRFTEDLIEVADELALAVPGQKACP